MPFRSFGFNDSYEHLFLIFFRLNVPVIMDY